MSVTRWFGRRDDADADIEVPRRWRKALESVLARLDRGHPDLPGALRDYVLTGSPESALGRVARCDDAPGALALWGSSGYPSVGDLEQSFYAGFESVPPEVALRWARVLEVVLVRNAYMLSLDPVGGGHWAEALVVQLTNVYASDGRSMPKGIPVDHEVIERLLAESGANPSDLLATAFRPSQAAGSYRYGRLREALRLLAGYEQAVRRHADVLRAVMRVPRAENQLLALEMLGPLGPDTLALFATELAEMATSTSSQVRAGATGPLMKVDAVAPLRSIATEGKPEQRLYAMRLLWSSGNPEVMAWAREQATADRAPNVRALIAEWASRPEADEPPALHIVDLPAIDWKVPVSPELRALLQRIRDEANKGIDKANASRLAQAERWEADHGQSAFWRGSYRRLDDDEPGRWVRALESGLPPKLAEQGVGVAEHLVSDVVERHASNRLLGPVALTVLMNHLGVLADRSGLSNLAAAVYNAHHDASGTPSFLELSTILDQMGAEGAKLVFDRYSRSYGDPLGRDWPDEHIAPFVAVNLGLVTDAIAPTERSYHLSPTAPFRALATLPSLPAPVVDTLYALALGSRKADRRPAQDALARVPGIEERVVTALASGKVEVRTVAAQWLQRLGYARAVTALEAAVAKEKHDVAKGALLDALQALGQPVEKYLDRASLATQASKGLAKGLPKDLAWLRWDGVPAVHWADTGEVVSSEVLQWFISQAVKAKSPEPNAVLRKYCAMFDKRDREGLGQYLLEAWMAEDTKPIGPDEARRLAEQQAQWVHQSMAQWPKHYEDDPLLGASVEEIAARYLPGFSRRPAGSAIASKGVLAVAAACAGERAADPVARYLKEWYGMRAAQGKALIAMLAWIEHPSATQLMLSVGSRFRTKSFQEEATRQAEALAERKGWSVGELADRTIPTAGFDETGTLELSYGDRAFTAVLLPDLSVELRSPEGKKVSSLPAPRQSDDEARAKDSKKALTQAKKELKAVIQLQTARLYEALCTERTWVFDDWQRYLNRHPLVRHLTQRLAWVATTAEGVTVFRPLDDGTLTDVDDDEVTVPPDALVAVAHDSVLDAVTVEAWQRHLDDYEVVPLFQQFGKGNYTLPAERNGAKEIKDFEGHLLEPFALRGRAGKLAYTRGAAEDGGWFYQYEKRFPTLGLSALVEFSGNPLPEENRTIALTALRFRRHAPGGSGSDLRLGDVPSVLLSEAYNDMRLMAGDGSGFDPDWEKKVEY